MRGVLPVPLLPQGLGQEEHLRQLSVERYKKHTRDIIDTTSTKNETKEPADITVQAAEPRATRAM